MRYVFATSADSNPPRPKIKGLLIDLNGTLHVGDQLTPRAARAVCQLRTARVPFIFW
jgi:ribonucleotide monophosphatase NagD (HAD superfamily)